MRQAGFTFVCVLSWILVGGASNPSSAQTLSTQVLPPQALPSQALLAQTLSGPIVASQAIASQAIASASGNLASASSQDTSPRSDEARKALRAELSPDSQGFAPLAYSLHGRKLVRVSYRSSEGSSVGFSDASPAQLASFSPVPPGSSSLYPLNPGNGTVGFPLSFPPPAKAPPANGKSPGRSSPGAFSPWIEAVELGRPEESPQETFEMGPVELSPCSLFEEELDKQNVLSRAPSYANVDRFPLFYVAPPTPESEFYRKFKKILEEKMYRELRKRLKKEWRAIYRDHPSMSNAFYEDRLLQINNIGKDPQEYDEFNVEYRTNEAKQNVFHRKKLEGEPDVGLFTWGPLTVKDSGALKFDLGTAAHAGELDDKLNVGEIKPKPFISTKDYRVETSFNVDVDPFQGYREGDIVHFFRRFGLTVDVNWLSDVLGREMVTTELELEADTHGEFAVFANIVIKSR